MRGKTRKIEVEIRDARFTFDVFKDANVNFEQEYSNEFIFYNKEDYDHALEVMEEHLISLDE